MVCAQLPCFLARLGVEVVVAQASHSHPICYIGWAARRVFFLTMAGAASKKRTYLFQLTDDERATPTKKGKFTEKLPQLEKDSDDIRMEDARNARLGLQAIIDGLWRNPKNCVCQRRLGSRTVCRRSRSLAATGSSRRRRPC